MIEELKAGKVEDGCFWMFFCGVDWIEKGSVLVLTAIDEKVKPVSCPGNGPVRVATLKVEPEEQNVFILK